MSAIETLYSEVTLCRGPRTERLWIPDQYAITGKSLKRKERNGWGNAWTVVEIHATGVPETKTPNGSLFAPGVRFADATTESDTKGN